MTYDQLTMPQFVQGFVKNILDEKNLENREFMLRYLGDIMEDTSDFSWVSAKASHAVLLCEMERGQVVWSDTSRIDRIRRAHAQKHQNKQYWGFRQKKSAHGFVKITKQGLALLAKITRLEGSYIGTFVPTVCRKASS